MLVLNFSKITIIFVIKDINIPKALIEIPIVLRAFIFININEK